MSAWLGVTHLRCFNALERLQLVCREVLHFHRWHRSLASWQSHLRCCTLLQDVKLHRVTAYLVKWDDLNCETGFWTFQHSNAGTNPSHLVLWRC